MAKQRTYFVKQAPQKEWFLLDAADLTLGRISSQIAMILQGKHKPTYTPHIDTGDFVVVTNCEKLVCTSSDKTYYWHTGYPGGIRSERIGQRMARNPDKVLRDAVKRMLPRGPLGRAMLKKLKTFPQSNHQHAAQQPKNVTETSYWEN